MTAITQTRMNVMLALAIPAAGLMYLIAGVLLSSSRSTVGALVALGVLKTLEPMIQSEPSVQTYDVSSSTFHKIAAGHATPVRAGTRP